jgi:hypothetical protein
MVIITVIINCSSSSSSSSSSSNSSSMGNGILSCGTLSLSTHFVCINLSDVT